MKPCNALIVMVCCISSCTTKYLGTPLGYTQAVSPSLLAPRTALSVLPLSPSTYPGNSAFFNQFPGLASFPSYRGHFSFPWDSRVLATYQPFLPTLQTQTSVDDAVDVAEEEEPLAPTITVAHIIDEVPSPPQSPFRTPFPNIPAGIGAQSTQPVFTQQLFKNDKFAAHGLFVINSKISPVLREIQLANRGIPSVVGTF